MEQQEKANTPKTESLLLRSKNNIIFTSFSLIITPFFQICFTQLKLCSKLNKSKGLYFFVYPYTYPHSLHIVYRNC